MKRMTGRKTTTYQADGDWYIDIIETEDEFEAWIWMGSYGIKSLMWGEPKQQVWGVVTRKDFIGRVKTLWTDYIEGYLEDVLEEEE